MKRYRLQGYWKFLAAFGSMILRTKPDVKAKAARPRPGHFGVCHAQSGFPARLQTRGLRITETTALSAPLPNGGVHAVESLPDAGPDNLQQPGLCQRSDSPLLRHSGHLLIWTATGGVANFTTQKKQAKLTGIFHAKQSAVVVVLWLKFSVLQGTHR